MRVFVTGATGLVGSAVVAELIGHGHAVLALTRSDAAAAAAANAGAVPVHGALGDIEVLSHAAAEADGVIHLAFSNDFSSPEALSRSVAEEGAALLAMGEALIGSGRPIVAVSGTPVLNGRVSTEEDPSVIEGPLSGRGRAVMALLDLSSRGVRSAAVRLPRTVHNEGKGGFAGLLTNIARRTQVSGYPGDGSQRWPAVHARDAASLFRIVLERADPGTAWHAVDDEGDAVRDIATVIGRRLGLPVQSVSSEAFGVLGPIFSADQPSSSRKTREVLGWQPTHARLLDDLELLQP
ncbi:SDR family oxidoreductase [Sphingomonas sp. BAUL-RG-20F-R05-02]|uniref:SDR family oxidoreductase n=1 Tax=Sphingomonas sp. BAUL-RG-20F-R05-02 TaxID=2914830 RepID=UPI001F5A831F|nr:SDR family oxidoreductase [Sphingomonas sp. BAUL-RG-20F-R05-02]